MKNRWATVIVAGCACFLFVAASAARAEDAASTVNQLSSELQQSGAVTQNEADAIKPELKNMVEKGASKEELKNVVTELSHKGVKGDDLKKSVRSMNDLVKQGESPKEAGNVVSRAAAQAHEQGLKGKDLAAKVHEAIQQRKTERTEEKKKVEKGKKESQGHAKKAEKETQQKGKKKGK